MSGLIKPKKYDWKDSNMALFGSDTDRKVKKESAQTEPAWRQVLTCQQPRLFVWRIEKFKVVDVCREDYGDFYTGDSYIVLNIYKDEDQLMYDVHFWIGKESTQDEYGTAAYKTVELDTLLDDKAIQHREVQQYESALFKSYFNHITYLKGGCASGFRHVEPTEYKPRLFHFSGNRKVKVVIREVKPSKQHLDPGDVFILDLGTQVYQWNGSAASKDEKYSAAQYLQQLKGSRHGKANVEVLEEEDVEKEHPFMANLSDEQVKTKAKEKIEVTAATDKKKSIMRLSDSDGSLNFTSVAEDNISKSHLDEQDVYIIDGGNTVYVYVGHKASAAEKKNALAYAHQYLKQSTTPFNPVAVVNKGMLVGRRAREFDKIFS